MEHQYLLHREQYIPRPLDEVWAFFSDAFNLELLTPDFLKFKVTTPAPIEFQPDTRIEYRLKLFGVPLKWRTRILDVEPKRKFVDLQERGPYRLWHHTHTFESTPEGGTRMTDTVRYSLPFGPLGRIAHAVFVRKSLDQIFEFRNKKVAELFPAEGEAANV